MSADIAIVILNYNGRHFLNACLTSLSRLTVPAEIVVADNGSDDGSVEYIRQNWPQVRALAWGTNVGFAAGYNRALAQVQTPWVVLLNNDAELAPDWPERLLAAAVRMPRAVILGGKLLLKSANVAARVLQSAGACFTDAGTAFEIGWGEADRGQYDRPTPVGSIPGAAMLIRRDVFFELGGFDAGYFAYLEDVDLCWRAWLAGYEVHYIPEAEAWHHFGGSAGGRTSPLRIRYMQRNRLANMLKNLEVRSWPKGLAVSLAYDTYRLGEYSLRRQWNAIRALAAGTLEFWQSIPQLLAERARIQRNRRVPDKFLRDHGLLAPATAGLREYRRLDRLGRKGEKERR